MLVQKHHSWRRMVWSPCVLNKHYVICASSHHWYCNKVRKIIARASDFAVTGSSRIGPGFGASERSIERPSEEKRGKMHDFCFTYPYGFVVLLGGLLGFLRKGSTSSLMGGAGSGLLLLLAGYLSHQAFQKGTTSSFALFLETGQWLPAYN